MSGPLRSFRSPEIYAWRVRASPSVEPVSKVLALALTIVNTRRVASQRSCMNAPFLKRWTTWLLPLLLLRAFIPVGFMLSSGPQGLQLTFCPSIHNPGVHAQQQANAVAGHQDSAEHSSPDHSSPDHSSLGHSSHSHHEHSPCPYGLIAAAACVEPGSISVAQVASDATFESHTAAVLSRSPTDRLRIRGPPSLS